MLLLSASCVSIALASKAGVLRLVEREGRFGPFVAIEDDRGIIEAADDMPSAQARVAAVLQRAA